MILLGVLSGVVWLATERDVQIAIAVALLLAVGIDAHFARRAVAPVALELGVADDLEAGRPSSWQLSVHGWNRPVSVLPLLVPGAEAQLVGDGRPGELAWPPLRRGLVPFAVVDVVSVGPLGLVESARRHVARFDVPPKVTPPPVEVDLRWPTPRAIAFGLTSGAPIGDDLFRSVRPYRRGDERRQVHWKSTAHHGELMVRESEGTGIVLVRFVVELGPPGPEAERVAGVALWIVTEALARGWMVELVTLDATSELAVLGDVGRPFGAPPRVVVRPPAPLPTVAAPVRSVDEARRRLAAVAHGRPREPDPSGWRGRRCTISSDGVAWT